jgi:pimeloyl-ACP methyl ester carboxylesterase
LQTVRHGALEIAYWREGAGPPIVWIQGLNADHTAWTSQLLAFRAEYDCLALDNRDVGRSGRATASYDLAEMAADVRAVLDDARWRMLTLSGSRWAARLRRSWR